MRVQKAIDWEKQDDQPVQIIFGLLGPESGDKVLHLQMIDRLAGQSVDDEFREQLFAVNDEDELLHYMKSRIAIEEEV